MSGQSETARRVAYRPHYAEPWRALAPLEYVQASRSPLAGHSSVRVFQSEREAVEWCEQQNRGEGDEFQRSLFVCKR